MLKQTGDMLKGHHTGPDLGISGLNKFFSDDWWVLNTLHNKCSCQSVMYIDLLDSSLKYLIQIGHLWHSTVKYLLIRSTRYDWPHNFYY